MSSGRLIVALLLILVGLSALLGFNFWAYFWPIVLILLGVGLLTRDNYEEGSSQTTGRDWLYEETVFGSVDKKVVAKDFRGGKIDCVFGRSVIDLREAIIVEGETARLQVNSVFGGVEITVPENWEVITEGTGVAGSFDDRTKAAAKTVATLKIKGSAVFGGVEIHN